MTVCDEWTRRKRRGVNVRHCTTEVSEKRGKREDEQERQRLKEGRGGCGGGDECVHGVVGGCCT